MPRQKRPLAEVDTNIVTKPTPGTKKRAKSSKKSNNNEITMVSVGTQTVPEPAKLPDGVEYLTFARPWFDLKDEKNEDEDEDSEDEDTSDELDNRQTEDRKKYTDKPVEDHPGYKWVVSKKGKQLLENAALDFMKRDQDGYAMYIYNDWTPYGENEVIENMVC
jgi:hypothetical protein